ncbi:hypothetical protein FRX31_031185 [Thalictrum thalictroides]|uniref:Uncharacterized protein n=1 Tax=Thalictrum thalictroides TaxID=46969 RepID=A0A7J6V3H5_THATH|nr:hypothetical protein FRX31_031185 [Thalictrum thalictroides]
MQLRRCGVTPMRHGAYLRICKSAILSVLSMDQSIKTLCYWIGLSRLSQWKTGPLKAPNFILNSSRIQTDFFSFKQS